MKDQMSIKSLLWFLGSLILVALGIALPPLIDWGSYVLITIGMISLVAWGCHDG